MDIKTRIEHEKLFSKCDVEEIKSLNRLGVYTVEDFINLTVEKEESIKRIVLRCPEKYRAYREILRYKYLHEPLVIDVMLDYDYEYIKKGQVNNIKLGKDISRLGFTDEHIRKTFAAVAREVLLKTGSCKMIDIIRTLDERFDNIAPFYIEYYDTHKKREQERYSTEENAKTTFNELKNQLVDLLNRRNELDLQISLLLEQMNTLEGGKVSNGRK